ncbi:MAG TPA: phosphoribosyltransferase domain-containing protein [Arenimonas sp.]|nr:phosphoribosyltransferase domain-containing protein [Arenimonas sp.]
MSSESYPPEHKPESALSAILPGGVITARISNSEMDPASLFEFAARENPKRSFLFLSKVLGKHLPVCPLRMLEIHKRIAGLIPDLVLPVVFVGMAETATGLAQGIFEAWSSENPDASSVFLHTTRYRIEGVELVEFQESHSHAPSQYLHVPNIEPARSRFISARSLILIDDEISTGNTFENLAKACIGLMPSIQRVHMACITDFMGSELRANLNERFSVPTSVSSLVHGEWSFESCDYSLVEFPAAAQNIVGNHISIQDNGLGRLGRTTAFTFPAALIDSFHLSYESELPTLVLGTGEFMHAAFVLALDLQRRGLRVFVQSTTRSPILEWGSITSKRTFPDNYGEGVSNYLYGVEPSNYGQIILCCEFDSEGGLAGLANDLGAQLIVFTSEMSDNSKAISDVY